MSVVPLEAVPAPALMYGAEGRLTACNRRCAELFATAPTELLRTGLPALFPHEPDVVAALRAGDDAPVRLAGRRFSGVPFTAEALAAGTGDGTTLVLVTELAGERLLSESRRQIDLAFEHGPNGMAIFDTDGRYVRVNRALCGLLGREAEQLVGLRDNALTHPDDRQSDVDAAWRILAGELDAWHCEKRFVRPDGEVVWALADLTFLRDDAGRPLCWVGQFRDITARRLAESRLRHMADHDDLTGVANRRRLVAELDLRLERAARHDEQGAVLVLDLDGFKEINDHHGHPAGDAVLVRTAAALRGRLRATDVLARLGGDEFAVVLPDIDAHAALRVAAELLAAVRHAGTGVTASCGAALYGPDRPGSPAAVLGAADRALYAAKRQGRDAARLAAG